MARGKLRIYLGAAPGVGKTYAMLDEGWRRTSRGTDVVVGYVESHGRPRTVAQIRDLEVIDRHGIEYRGQTLEELDLDAILARHPTVVLVDELAHTNVPGSRHEKRWQDVEALRDAGIEVISTVNVQHLASLNDVVEQITGVKQNETVPDAIVRAADQIELVDMSPDALRRRMAHGNVYPPEKVDAALAHYFRIGNLSALRELALLWMADRVDSELQRYRERHGISETWETKERVVVAISGAPDGERLLRRGARMAARLNSDLVGVYVRSTGGFSQREPQKLEEQCQMLGELGGRYAEVTGVDIAAALVSFARAENATQLILGASGRSRWAELTSGSVVNRIIRGAGDIDVHVISSASASPTGLPRFPRPRHLAEVPTRRRQIGFGLATAGMALLGLALVSLRSSIGLPGALLFLLLGVVSVAVVGGVWPAAVAVVVGGLIGDYYFTHPYHSLYIASLVDVIAVLAFVAVAAVVSVLVDRLARRAQQVVRAQAEAEALARLAGSSVLGAESLLDLVADLRRTFDLESVAVLTPDRDAWRVVTAAGAPVPTSPEGASFSSDLDDGAVLVLEGSTSAEDRRLLQAFVAQLRLAQERVQLGARADEVKQLEEGNSLRTALLAAVSHDLRTPLAAIKAAATSLLADDIEWDPPARQGFAKTIDSEADRLTQLVSNLLDMSRLQTGSLQAMFRPVRVEDVLYATVEGLGPAGAAVVLDIDDSLPLVATDPGLLERALGNVIDNALTWSPDGTAVRVDAARAGDRVQIRVVDQGPGIAPDQREAVFLPFQQLGDGGGASPHGVGLGLAVARGFAEAIGAGLTLDDTPGGGTTAVFSLPRSES
jgi:two-component system, OmpR family, sensor histidine kinase KdpD